MASEYEVRLVSRILAHESGALDQFISDFRPFLYAILTRQLNLRPEDADEVFQRFLVHIWEDDFRRLRQWRRVTSLAAFVGMMARNLARDYRRKRRLTPTGALSERGEAGATLQHVEGQIAETRRLVQAALAELSSRDRDLIHRRYYLGQSYREMGLVLGMTTSHVGVALSRAVKRLRPILEKSLERPVRNRPSDPSSVK